MLKALAALAGSKAALAGTAAVTLAATGVGVKAAATGNPNPLNWGSSVTQQVTTCKALPTADLQHGHGIGQCVSAFAKTHGASESDSHGQSGSHPTPGAHPGNGDHPSGSPTTAPPTPASHATPPANPTPASLATPPAHPTPGAGH